MTTTNAKTIRQILSLNHEITEEITKLCSYKEYAANTIVSPYNEKKNKAIFLIEGVCKHSYIDKLGANIIFHITQAPEFMPYTLNGFFLNSPSSTSCTAITQVKGYEISSEDLVELTQKYPQIHKFYFSTILRIHHAMQSKEIRIFEYSSTERYIHFVNTFSNVIDEIPLKDIAAYLNIQPGSLSRIRKILNT